MLEWGRACQGRWISSDELWQHRWRLCSAGTDQDSWVCIHGVVLQLRTDFLARHPGGQAAVTQWAGRDATRAFEAVHHSSRARQWASSLIIGYMEGLERQEKHGLRLLAGAASERRLHSISHTCTVTCLFRLVVMVVLMCGASALYCIVSLCRRA
mmetsp:Transcript_70263/g.205490  ORF Transcript_70263/g.205490 Transcript_70263/m.205490 type:complete len:155 (-) Transcript_70263:113-577(-)